MQNYSIDNFYPADGYYVTKIIEGQQYKGKIIMPDTIKEPYRYGEVVKCGKEKDGQTVRVATGDILLFGHKTGFDLLIGLDKYVCIAADSCVGHYDMRFHPAEQPNLPDSVYIKNDDDVIPFDDGSVESYKPEQENDS